MDHDARLAHVRTLLQQEQRLPYRVLKRRFQLDDDLLEHRSSIPATGHRGALAPVGEARSALRPRSGAREGWVRGGRERGKTLSTDYLTDVLDDLVAAFPQAVAVADLNGAACPTWLSSAGMPWEP